MVEYTYDAWGNVLSITGMYADTLGVNNPIRYRGYYQDFETGFYYLQSRYYDPAVRRWLSPDTTAVLTATPMALTDKNLYAYCDNNPVVRGDDGGEFWHIVVGGIVGGLISGITTVVTNAITGNSLTDGLGTAIIAGAASGALAATGVGVVGMALGNAAISMAQNAADQVIENEGFENFDVGDMLYDGVVGGTIGAMGGPGKGSKHLTNLGKQTMKRTFNEASHKGIGSGIKAAGKAFAYYGKNTKQYYIEFFRNTPSNLFSSIGSSITNEAVKQQFFRWIGD